MDFAQMFCIVVKSQMCIFEIKAWLRARYTHHILFKTRGTSSTRTLLISISDLRSQISDLFAYSQISFRFSNLFSCFLADLPIFLTRVCAKNQALPSATFPFLGFSNEILVADKFHYCSKNMTIIKYIIHSYMIVLNNYDSHTIINKQKHVHRFTLLYSWIIQIM